jgi:uncharacterized protein YkwD
MKPAMLLLPILFAAIVSCSRVALPAAQDQNSARAEAPVDNAAMLKLVNQVRQKGCKCGSTYYKPAPALTWNSQLEAAAAVHSKDMYDNNYFSHTGQNGSSAGERIKAAGYTWSSYGENIAMGQRSASEVIKGWLTSPGHCANIMNPSFREMGMANSGVIWVQVFGYK